MRSTQAPGLQHGQEPTRSLQRRRHRHHHHHHGAGAEGAAWRQPAGAGAAVAGASQLHPELRLRRHLLEQPSPHAARRRQGQRRGAVGESAPAVLAFAVSLRHRLDGREPLRAFAHRVLRPGAADGRAGLLGAAAVHHQRRLDHTGACHRARLEGQALAAAVRAGHHALAVVACAGAGGVCGRGADVAGAGSAHRKGAGGHGGFIGR